MRVLPSRARSAREERAGRMVGAVQVHVTVHATLVVDEPGRRQVRRLGGGESVRRRMALLAEPRPRDPEQLFLVAAVWIVAVGAVLHDGRVLVEERPALVGVAGEAGLIHRAGEEQLVVRRAVRVV